MLNAQHLDEGSAETPERRARARQKLRSVAYVDLGPSNGGLVLNLSEGGLAFSSALRISADQLPPLSFKLPGVSELIEAQARIVWVSESRREAGVRFEELPEGHARKINDWIETEHGLHAQLQQAAVAGRPMSAAEATAPARDETETANTAPPLVTCKTVAGQFPRSTPPSEPLMAESKDVRRTRALSVAVFSAIALLAFLAGITLDHRRQPAPSKPIEQPSPLQANVDGNPAPATPVSAPPSNDAVVVSAKEPSENSPGTSDSPVDSSTSAQSASQASVDDADAKPTDLRRRSAIGDRQETETDKPTSLSDRNESSSSIGKPRKTERSAGSPTASFATSSQRADAHPMSPRVADPKHLQEEAAADKALEQQQLRQSSTSPRTTIGSEATGIQTTDRDADTTKAATSSAALRPGSVEVRVPPSPSARIPPELRTQPSTERRLQIGQLVSRVEPAYPPDALSQELQGTVKAHIAINSEGEVEAVDATGSPLLVEAATAALHQWRYTPTLFDGNAIPADQDVVVIFRLPASPN